MPALALRVLFFLLGSTSAGCLPPFELSDALRAKAGRKPTDSVKQKKPVHYGLLLHINADGDTAKWRSSQLDRVTLTLLPQGGLR